MLTVVTVAHRSAAELAVLLPTLPTGAEVIVVDTDGSAAGVPATVVERHELPGRPSGVLTALTPGPLRREPWRSGAPRIVGWALAAALAAPTELLRRLGPFDPAAFLFYEDMDLCLRARAAGVPTVLHPEVELTHTGGHSYDEAPVDVLARRRREVVSANLGARAQGWDHAAQIAEYAVRSWRGRDRARLRAVLDARG